MEKLALDVTITFIIFSVGNYINTTDDIKPNIPTNISDNETIIAPVPRKGTSNEKDIIKPVNTSKKLSSIIVAKNKVFNKKLKTKLYSVVLKSKNSKVLKNTWFTLKIKGKLFKAKINRKGKATFKITKLNKKGNFKGVVKFNGNKK